MRKLFSRVLLHSFSGQGNLLRQKLHTCKNPDICIFWKSEFGKLFLAWGKSTFRKIRDKTEGTVIRTRENRSWFSEGVRKKDRLGRL